ncbi:hypothetical protein GINT2_000197 [Glugoides intestinalis]
MLSQTQKTIDLMKKAYDQPILFHLLHCNLSHILLKTAPTYEITDDWSKLLIYSAHPNKIPNQSLEIKIQSIIKRLRPPFDNEKKLKIMVICYYLLNRVAAQTNHIVLFELVSNFLCENEYIDSLIIKLLSNVITGKIFNVEQNRKITGTIIQRMVEILKEKDLTLLNKLRSIVCFIQQDIKPFELDFIEISADYKGYKTLELLCLYAKYTGNVSFIKEVLPNNISFVEGLNSFISGSFYFSCCEKFDLSKCLVKDNRLFMKIKEDYEDSDDKKKFVSDLLEFVSNLK